VTMKIGMWNVKPCRLLNLTRVEKIILKISVLNTCLPNYTVLNTYYKMLKLKLLMYLQVLSHYIIVKGSQSFRFSKSPK
jgi:hypothetical protein